jgi:Na+/melibiose symporter-like transporter
LTENSVSRQFDELKTFLLTYVLIAPLLSALFAEHIDNKFIACILFVGLVGTAFCWFRRRLADLDEWIQEMVSRIDDLDQVTKDPPLGKDD